MMTTSAVVINFIFFQLGWLACVLGGAGQWHWAGSLLVVAIVIFHLTRANRPRIEFLLIGAALLIGTTWDSLLVWTGLLEYGHGLFHNDLAPHWIIAMWALFATTLNVSLRWLKGRATLAILFGAIGGPLAYFSGSRLGAVNMPDMLLALTALGMGWAVLMPLLVMISQRLDGFIQPEAN